MDTFRSLARGVLPPSGNPISLKRTGLPGNQFFPGNYLAWVDSGTSALALALLETKRRAKGVSSPNVILPAYCCPDLVAAATYAGLRPVIVDLADSDTRYDTEKLGEVISEQTIAVIAVNFMGIRENTDAIKRLTASYPNICIIEDNAQWFPETPDYYQPSADYTVFSFGRGKPFSLLGGGLLVSKTPTETYQPRRSNRYDEAVLSIKYRLYNLLINPRLYQLIDRNPLLSIGETVYEPLEAISALDGCRATLLESNLERYMHFSRMPEKAYREGLGDINALQSLADSNERLLRYPLLVPDQNTRTALLQRLNTEGLGATALYRNSLPEVPKVPEGISCPLPIENAQSFAGRLLTLPVHGGVTARHIDRTLSIIKGYLSRPL